MGLRVVVMLAITINCGHAWGQLVISTKSGLINYIEGMVLLSGEPIVRNLGVRVEMKEGSDLRTEDGRAEVLLNPGVFLRIGKKSTVRMISNNLADTRIEFVSGSAIIGPGRRLNAKENWAASVSIAYQETIVHLRKNGTYRFDAEPAQLRVYEGEASVSSGELTEIAGAGEMIALAKAGSAEKFDVTAIDALGLWSKHRAAYISMPHESAGKRHSTGVWPRAQIPAISH